MDGPMSLQRFPNYKIIWDFWCEPTIPDDISGHFKRIAINFRHFNLQTEEIHIEGLQTLLVHVQGFAFAAV